MDYYISDLHFGHENIIKMCSRPFSCIEEMDAVLLENWNNIIHKNDNVYIIGDLIYKANNSPEYYLKQLKGKKHLIIGNHDKSWLKYVDTVKYFESVDLMKIINTGKGNATLCHYPMLEFEGEFMIHGHVHTKANKLAYWEYLKRIDALLNAGADINGYKPVSLDELIENNNAFKNK